MTQRYKCSICGEEFGELPPEGRPVGTQRFNNLTMIFPDARVHNLKLLRPKKIKESEIEPTKTSD
jgi:hypothetical protein